MVLGALKRTAARHSGRRACLALLAGAYRGWPAGLTPPFRCRLLLGTLYPAYASYKAVRNKDVREYVRWMMYWIVLALFMATEAITDTLVSWFPFYYEIKMAFVVWLLSPYTRGASLLYRKFVHPTLSSKEKEIDHFILQAKERGYETFLSFGKKGINVAATAAVQVAAKSQSALAGHLRSFSMQDLRSIPETATVHYSDPLYLEEQELCRRPIGKRDERSQMSGKPDFLKIAPSLVGDTSSATVFSHSLVSLALPQCRGPAGRRRPAMQQLGSDSPEACWSDSELSATPRGCCEDPALPELLGRSQSLRQVKKKPPAKEGSTRAVRSRSRKKVLDQDS